MAMQKDEIPATGKADPARLSGARTDAATDPDRPEMEELSYGMNEHMVAQKRVVRQDRLQDFPGLSYRAG
jgi:hypothetical protein